MTRDVLILCEGATDATVIGRCCGGLLGSAGRSPNDAPFDPELVFAGSGISEKRTKRVAWSDGGSVRVLILAVGSSALRDARVWADEAGDWRGKVQLPAHDRRVLAVVDADAGPASRATAEVIRRWLEANEDVEGFEAFALPDGESSGTLESLLQLAGADQFPLLERAAGDFVRAASKVLPDDGVHPVAPKGRWRLDVAGDAAKVGVHALVAALAPRDPKQWDRVYQGLVSLDAAPLQPLLTALRRALF